MIEFADTENVIDIKYEGSIIQIRHDNIHVFFDDDNRGTDYNLMDSLATAMNSGHVKIMEYSEDTGYWNIASWIKELNLASTAEMVKKLMLIEERK